MIELLLLLLLGWKVDTLSLPDGSKAGLVRSSSKHPAGVVFWLHGGLGANNPAKGLQACAGFGAWADSGKFALICPSAWPASPWWSLEAQQRLETSLCLAAKKYPALNSKRRFLTGVSDGGSGALWLAAGLRPQWGTSLRGVAVWSTDPSVLVQRGIPWNPGSLEGLRVRWTAGAKDRLYPLEDVRQWWARLLQVGVRLETTETPLADHDLVDHQADLGRFPAWMRAN